jgi:hypothetical protein
MSLLSFFPYGYITFNCMIPKQINAINTLIHFLSIIKILFIFSGSAAQRGLWPPRPRSFVITHTDAPQSVGLLWTSGQLVAETST